ncbi:uncharacterized protein YjbI with pentapeptide repeats [Phyllobacterium sp. 1468]|uniref:anti-phage Hailong system effector protein HalA n=1 Tax=Phyllobacterium sp. 1468 TaxID=2817759 RepID=UPI0028599073|nr:pentapeptide repeat-containing protein [Phyllobacterium sp. 1468]MDR6632291.1 uncharacterized protein YjbI with pentapeptide repeats [Phyllobacterium sp. 1468]
MVATQRPTNKSGVGAVREKRSGSFFEPIYDPTDTQPFPEDTWPKTPNQRKDHVTLTSGKFLKTWQRDEKIVISNVIFDKCDFLGDFTSATPTFKNCEFDRCDFGLTKWRRAKFKGCKFYRCSLTLATFEGCEFRDCKFSEIGLSGNETLLIGSTFTNPAEFINAAYVCVDEETLKTRGRGVIRQYQIMRLEGTRATVARAIMNNMMTYGDEKTYYKSIELYQNISIKAKIMEVKYKLSENTGLDESVINIIDLVTLCFESVIINIAGKLNNWGASIARPTLIGALLIAIFAFLYWVSGIRETFLGALSASIDITLLIGYTKHAANNLTSGTKFVFSLNMISGLIWYSIFLPTIINRVSRVR